MNGDTAVYIFIETVSAIMNVQKDNMYAITNAGRYICFSPSGFRAALRIVIAKDGICESLEPGASLNKEKVIKELMTVYRTLGYIVCDDERFSCTQRINGKAKKVIAADAAKYELLKALTWNRYCPNLGQYAGFNLL